MTSNHDSTSAQQTESPHEPGGLPVPPSPLDRLNDECVCPDCGSAHFNRGPTAGLSLNVRCAGCGSKFWYSPPFTPARIDNPDCVYQLGTRLTLEQILTH